MTDISSAPAPSIPQMKTFNLPTLASINNKVESTLSCRKWQICFELKDDEDLSECGR